MSTDIAELMLRAAAELRRLSAENAEMKERIFRLESALKKSPGQTDQIPAESPTAGMNLEERIKHVGGRENAAGYVEFGSVMAVDALIRHVLRDLPAELQKNPQGKPIKFGMNRSGFLSRPAGKMKMVVQTGNRVVTHNTASTPPHPQHSASGLG